MNRSVAWIGAAACGLAALLIVLGVTSAQRAHVGRMDSGVHVGTVDLSNLSRTDATAKLTAAITMTTSQPLTLRAGDQQWRLIPSDLGVHFDVPGTVEAAYAVGRDGNPLAQLEKVFSKNTVSASVAAHYQIDDAKLRDDVQRVGAVINQPLRDASVTIVGTHVQVTHAQPGRQLDVDATISQLRDRLGSLSTEPIDLSVAVTAPSPSDAQVADAAAQAGHWLDHDVTIQSPDGNAQITKAQIASMVRFLPGDGALTAALDQGAVQEALAPIIQRLSKPSRNADFALQQGKLVVTQAGQEGRQVDADAVTTAIVEAIEKGAASVAVPVQTVRPDLLDVHDAASAQHDAAVMAGFPLTVQAGDTSYTLTPRDLTGWLTLATVQQDGHAHIQVGLQGDAISRFLNKVSDETATLPRDAKLGKQGAFLRVVAPAVNGRQLDVDASTGLLVQTLKSSDQRTVTLPFKTVAATVDGQSIGQAGITDLVAEGTSNFAGSPPERIVNIRRGAQLIDGVLIPVGAVFSFDDTIGNISMRTGFVTGLVIKDHETRDGVGGGICQVSTTLFRSAFYAGLPIVERHDHSYAVPYYVQGGYPEGFDATIYSPDLDLKFKNDTPGPLLIQTSVNVANSTLTISLFGTKMDRTVKLIPGPITNRKAHPADLYRPEPSLGKGVVKQVDWAHDGFDVWVARSITVNGHEVSHDVFSSHAEPWQAIYLVGTGGVPVAPPAKSKPAANATPGPTPGATAQPSGTPGLSASPSPVATPSQVVTPVAGTTPSPTKAASATAKPSPKKQ